MTQPGVAKDLTLAIDVGTGSVRAALVDAAGTILSIAAVEQHQVVPAFGWSEQSVTGWWTGVVAGDPRGVGPGAGRGAPYRCRLCLRADARHRAGRRRRRPDASPCPALERQANRGARGGLRGGTCRRRLPAGDREPRDPGLARLQARLAARSRSRRLCAGLARADAEGLHQPAPDRRGRHGSGRRLLQLPHGPRHRRLVDRNGRNARSRHIEAAADPRRLGHPRHRDVRSRRWRQASCGGRRSSSAAPIIPWRCSARAPVGPASPPTLPGPPAS